MFNSDDFLVVAKTLVVKDENSCRDSNQSQLSHYSSHKFESDYHLKSYVI